MARYLRSEEMVVFERIVKDALFTKYEYVETSLGPIYIAWKETGDCVEGIWGAAGVARMYEAAEDLNLEDAKKEMIENAYSFLYHAGKRGLLEDTGEARFGGKMNGSG